jgi:hypothetical protein
MKILNATYPTILFAFAIAAVLPFESCIAADPSVSAIARTALEPKVSELVDLIGKGRIDAMIDRIGPVPDTDRLYYEQTRQRLINLYSSAGKYDGFDIAGYKVLTPRFQIAYALVYFDKRPVLFEFGFYRINDTWRPQTMAVETNFKTLLDTLPLQR